jgi:hypothetical protein
MWSPQLGEEVILSTSGLRGLVLAVSQYLYTSTLYYVEYLDNQGNPGAAWFNAEQLKPVL